MNNDLGFLAIFIILPTILIVSGFWLILIVRSDLRLRAATETTTRDEKEAEATQEAAETTLAELPVEHGESTQPALLAEEDQAAGPDEDAFPAAAEEDEDFWTPEPKPMPAPSLVAVSLAEAGTLDGDDESIDVTESDVPVDGHLGDTASLPDELPPAVTAEEPAESEAEDEPERPRRQPAARMVPSTEHVKRRTGQQARRAPIINPRSSDRDEDAVESPDGG